MEVCPLLYSVLRLLCTYRAVRIRDSTLVFDIIPVPVFAMIVPLSSFHWTRFVLFLSLVCSVHCRPIRITTHSSLTSRPKLLAFDFNQCIRSSIRHGLCENAPHRYMLHRERLLDHRHDLRSGNSQRGS